MHHRRAARELTTPLLLALTLGGCPRAVEPAPTPPEQPARLGAGAQGPTEDPEHPPPVERPAVTTPASDHDNDDAPAVDAPEILRDPLEERTLPPAPRSPETKTKDGCEDGRYAVGEEWKVDCNTCVCSPNGLATCTLIACGVTG